MFRRCQTSSLHPPLATTQRRSRFYRPVLGSGLNVFKRRFGAIHKTEATWQYQPIPMTPKPKPKTSVNPYHGKLRLFNPIPSREGIVQQKANDWGYPYREPPPRGLRQSPAYFPHFFNAYFPNVECRLVLDSVLNNETTEPIFHVPLHLHQREIRAYLQNIYGLDNILKITTRNKKGRFYKNELGAIRSLPDYKEVTVVLDAPVVIDLKSLKGSEDDPDSKKLSPK